VAVSDHAVGSQICGMTPANFMAPRRLTDCPGVAARIGWQRLNPQFHDPTVWNRSQCGNPGSQLTLALQHNGYRSRPARASVPLFSTRSARQTSK